MKKKALLPAVLYALITAATLFSLCSAFGFQREAPSTEKITHIRQALVQIDGGEWEEISLPHVLSGLAPDTPVSLTAAIHPQQDDSIFVQSDYAPAVIRLNGRPVFEMGKAENYPRLMKSSGREAHVVEVYGDSSELELRIDYRSPRQGGRLLLNPPMVGTVKEILMERSQQYGIPMLLSVVQIACGAAMMLISVYVGLIDRKGLLFLWLGLFSLLTGLWFLGDNNAAVALLPRSALLYFASYIGLFSSPIVLFRFVRESIEFENHRLPGDMEIFFCLTVLTILLLQITGVFPFYRSILPFFLLLNVGILLLNLLILRESRHTQNIDARRFSLPMGVILISDVSGLLGFLFPQKEIFSLLHQVLILLFLLIIGIYVGIYVKDSLDLQQQMTKLAYEEKLLRMQNEEQRDLADQLVRNEEALSRQRHDLRHHLAVLQELAGDNSELAEYLSALETKIPRKQETFSENRVVNAVISHYASRCRQEGIRLEIRLALPEITDPSVNSDLCVIFSNLLENAAEACERMEGGERYIHMNSTWSRGTLTVLMKNSFDGKVSKVGERFCSMKRDDFGVGLSSVQSIAEGWHGGADFHAEGNLFLSSVYLHLPQG